MMMGQWGYSKDKMDEGEFIIRLSTKREAILHIKMRNEDAILTKNVMIDPINMEVSCSNNADDGFTLVSREHANNAQLTYFIL